MRQARVLVCSAAFPDPASFTHLFGPGLTPMLVARGLQAWLQTRKCSDDGAGVHTGLQFFFFSTGAPVGRERRLTVAGGAPEHRLKVTS
jgi:hypothetical protein